MSGFVASSSTSTYAQIDFCDNLLDLGNTQANIIAGIDTSDVDTKGRTAVESIVKPTAAAHNTSGPVYITNRVKLTLLTVIAPTVLTPFPYITVHL